MYLPAVFLIHAFNPSQFRFSHYNCSNESNCQFCGLILVSFSLILCLTLFTTPQKFYLLWEMFFSLDIRFTWVFALYYILDIVSWTVRSLSLVFICHLQTEYLWTFISSPAQMSPTIVLSFVCWAFKSLWYLLWNIKNWIHSL